VAARDEVFTTVYEDASGRHDGSVASWNAAKVYSDTRIGPGLTAKVPLEIAVPTTMAGDVLTVRATLKYRSLPEGWPKEQGLKGVDATNPVTIMAEATATVVKVETSLFERLASAAVGVQATSFALRALFLLVIFAAYAWLATLWFRGRRGKRPDTSGAEEEQEADMATPEDEMKGSEPGDVQEMRGFLPGLDSDVPREPDRVDVTDPAQPEDPPVSYTPSSDEARARAPKKRKRKGQDET
jgi:hypothetical protein